MRDLMVMGVYMCCRYSNSITIGQSHLSRSGGKGASLCDVRGGRVEFGLIRWDDEASTPLET
jgi:hypothetical protein